jgi:hypothetical protein
MDSAYKDSRYSKFFLGSITMDFRSANSQFEV